MEDLNAAIQKQDRTKFLQGVEIALSTDIAPAHCDQSFEDWICCSAYVAACKSPSRMLILRLHTFPR